MKPTLSILFITTSFPRFTNDFAGSFIYRFAKYLVRDGMQVTVVCPAYPSAKKTEELEGIIVKRFSYFYPEKHQVLCYDGGGILANIRNSLLAKIQVPFFLIAMFIAVLKEYNQHQLIHCHWLPTLWPIKLIRFFKRKKKPIVFTNWGSDTRLMPLWLIKTSLKNIEGFISTAAETDEHLKKAGIHSFRQIMAPIDEEKFNITTIDKTKLRQEFSIDRKQPIICFVGRLNYFKDPLTLIESCALLKQKKIAFTALLAGDGDLKIHCQQLINAKNLTHHVYLLGSRQDTETLLAAATVMVHISPVENTWANAIAEAMFIGCPVILSNAGYTKHTFTHNKDCLIIPAKNPQRLADEIETLINSPELKSKLITGAKILLDIKKKNSHEITKQTINYYHLLVNQT